MEPEIHETLKNTAREFFQCHWEWFQRDKNKDLEGDAMSSWISSVVVHQMIFLIKRF